MSQKKMNVGILFNFQITWMGGIIYVINLVKTLNYLPDEEKPKIYLFYTPELKKYLKDFSYPYFEAVEYTFPSEIGGNILSWLKRKNIYFDKLVKKYALDALYPARNFPVKNRTRAKVVAWYADLQHLYYPEFFTRMTLLHRRIRIFLMLRNTSDLIVSSEAVKRDFENFYKLRKDIRIHIYHFVSVLEEFKDLNIDELRKKYQLPKQYFMVSNQFHKHKNHKVLLKALIRLKKEGRTIHMAMTGRFPEASTSTYMQELHSLINENHLQNQISFLGIIPRDEQLFLMKYSQAVIQPSLFEGWSTVIEDARSLQAPVIAVSLPVNIEQLGKKHEYFDPHDDSKLAEILANYPERNLDDKFYEDYNKRILEAARIFMNILKSD